MTRGRCGSLVLQRVIFHSLTSPVLPAHKEPNMPIIGCDYHPGFQQIALVDTARVN